MKRNNLHRIFEPSDCLYNPQDYIEGKLSADEQYYFEKHILSCSICRDEYEGLLAMHDTKELPSIVKELNKQVDNYLRPTVKPVFIKKHKIWSIAAFILVLIGSGFFINYYTQYSAKEFAAEEMVSQSVESNDNTPSMAFDSTAKPVTISSSNNSELKNKLNDQAINRKISKTSSEKKIEPKDDKFDAIESTNIVDDKFGIEEDEVYEEAEVSESIISSESKNKLAVKESKETISLNSKKQQKDEAPLTNYEPTSDFNRAKSSGINRKTVKGYTVENYLENGIIAYKNGEYKKAIDQLKKSLKYEAKSDQTIYYLGLSYAAIENTKKALKYYNELLNNKESSYHEDTKWQKSLLLIKIEKQKQAVVLLNELIKSDRYRKVAQDKLDSLKR